MFAKRSLINILICFSCCSPALAQFSPVKSNPLESALIESSVQMVELPDLSTAEKDGVLYLWHQKPCLISQNKVYEINVKGLNCNPCQLQDINKPTNLQISQDGRLIGITSDGKDDFVLIESTSMHGFERIKIPIHVTGPTASNILLCARGNFIFILMKKNLLCFDGIKWESKTLPHMEGTFYFPNEMLLSRERLYLRYDFGHYGGGLAYFDLTNGECKKIYDKSAVTDMQLDNKERLWFTHQDPEGGIVHGVLAYFENDKINVAYSDKKESNPFLSLAITPTGAILLGTLDKGVYKFVEGLEEAKVEKLTPDWNASAFILNVVPIENDGFCFFASGHGVIVSNNLVDEKYKSTNSASMFSLNMKKYFLQTAGNKQYFHDTAAVFEQAGKFAQAAAFYLLSAIDFANDKDQRGAELAIACATRAASQAPDKLISPLTRELLTIAKSEHIESIKIKKYALNTIQGVYKDLKLNPDSNLESAISMLKLFPEDIQLVRKRNMPAKNQPQFNTETDTVGADAAFTNEPAFGSGGGTTKQAEELMQQMQMQNQPAQ